MAADFNPLDTSQRQKVLNIIGQLADAGLSEADIMRYFGITQGMGQQNLQQAFGAAQDQLGLAFQPELMDARNNLGANPLLADSGYANRVNRQLMTDIAARQGAAYNSAAADEAQRQTDYLRELYNQRIGYKQNLGQAAYQTMTGLPRKQRWQDQIAQGVGTIAGAGIGAALGGPAGAGIGASVGSGAGSGGGGGYIPRNPSPPSFPGYGTAEPNYQVRRSSYAYRPRGDY